MKLGRPILIAAAILIASTSAALAQRSDETLARNAEFAELASQNELVAPRPPAVYRQDMYPQLTYRHLRHFLIDRNLGDGVEKLGPIMFAAPKARWWWLRPEMDDVEEARRRFIDVTSIEAEELNLQIGLRTTGLKITFPIR